MVNSYARHGYYWASIGGVSTKANWFKRQRLWAQGCQSATMEVTQCESGAARG